MLPERPPLNRLANVSPANDERRTRCGDSGLVFSSDIVDFLFRGRVCSKVGSSVRVSRGLEWRNGQQQSVELCYAYARYRAIPAERIE